MYIDDPEQLSNLIDSLSDSPFVCIDTEFMRERTYYAKLCLIQISTDDVAAIIDPFAIEDMSPLLSLLKDERVVKVLHAGSQDIEIFYKMMGSAPSPVFDTQIAATLAGFPQQVGYGALVQDIAGEQIDKSDTFTDWSKRPLSGTQIEYAQNDVLFLPGIYRTLMDRLESEGRLTWLDSDFAHLSDPATYEVIPEKMWKRVKRRSSLNRRSLGVLLHLAAWRELEAQRRDKPRKWILGDESLVEIARRAPTTKEELRSIRGVSDKLPNSSNEGLLAAVQSGLETGQDDLPPLERRERTPAQGDGVLEMMSALVKLRAKEHGVAVPLLASRGDLEGLASGDTEESPLLEGWRKTLIGEELVEMLNGRISIYIENNQLHVNRKNKEESAK